MPDASAGAARPGESVARLQSDLALKVQAAAVDLIELMDAADLLGIDLGALVPGGRRRPGRRTVAQVLGVELPPVCYTSPNA